MKCKYLYIFCVWASFPVKAQTDVQNQGTIFTTSITDTLFIEGSFTNTASASFTNNGQFYVRHNLVNNQSIMSAGTGTLLLTGNSLQTIGGTQAFKTFHLTTNNAAGVLLNNNLDVNGLHTFTTGIITSSATPNYLSYEAGASYSGSGDAAHVNGWVKKHGSTSFAFPVGNGTVLRPVTITNLSAVSEFNARHNMSTANPTIMQPPIMSVDGFESWTINRVSGGTAQVTMNWDKPRVNFPDYILADIRAVYNNGGMWANQGGSATGNVASTGVITSNGMNTFGDFTLGSISFALPLQFIGIWALAEPNRNIVQWQTASEFNVNRFEIQRSHDGTSYYKIGQVPALNTNTAQVYKFTDHMPLPGASWYRIQSVDMDGARQFSPVVLVSADHRAAYFNLVNKMVSDVLYLAIGQNYTGAYNYQILNTTGEVMQNGRVSFGQSGIFVIPVKNQLLRGAYIFHLYNDKHRLTEKILVK